VPVPFIQYWLRLQFQDLRLSFLFSHGTSSVTRARPPHLKYTHRSSFPALTKSLHFVQELPSIYLTQFHLTMTYNEDVEDAHAADERTPMLRNSSHQDSSHVDDEDKWSALYILRFFGGGVYAPDPSTYDPIEILLNTEDEEKRDELTRQWRDNKLSELSFVGVVVCTRCCHFSRFNLQQSLVAPWAARTLF
jgi:hypothetical protein